MEMKREKSERKNETEAVGGEQREREMGRGKVGGGNGRGTLKRNQREDCASFTCCTENVC